MIVCCSVLEALIRLYSLVFFFFQAEDGIRDLVRSRGLGDVYKRQDEGAANKLLATFIFDDILKDAKVKLDNIGQPYELSLIHI